jgi:hypothetical protein
MRNWYIRNQDRITWFIVGWLSFASLDNLVNGDYIWAAVLAFLAYCNYKLEKIRLQ